jgi:mannose-6-phosphate isomerase-like protein (cupin superfamily)
MLIYKQQKVARSKEVKSKVHELTNLLYELNDQGGYFINFISTKGIQAGIIRLHPGENDMQEPHSVDEVYYVIEGNGFIKLDGKDHEIKQGTSIFVPAKADHSLIEISKTL